MRYAAMFPDAVTGRLVPYCGKAGSPIEFDADDQKEANRTAKAMQLPHAVLLMPAEMMGSRPCGRAHD